MRLAHRRFAEDLLLLARDFHPVTDVGAGVILGERPQVVTRDHPLGQLAEVFPIE